MSTRPDEIPFDEPAGQPPLEPSPFTEPGPAETPAFEPDRLAPDRPDECPPDTVERDEGGGSATGNSPQLS